MKPKLIKDFKKFPSGSYAYNIIGGTLEKELQEKYKE